MNDVCHVCEDPSVARHLTTPLRTSRASTLTDGNVQAPVGATTVGAVTWTAIAAIGGNRVFVPQDSMLHSFPLAGCGAATCTPTWSVDLGATIANTAPPVVTPSGQVVTITEEGDMIAVSAATGAEQWRADLDWTLPGFGLGPRPGVAVAGDVLYASAPETPSGSVLRAFPADGCGTPTCTPLWTASTPEAMSAPAVAGGVVYVGTNGAVQAYAAAGCGSATCSPVMTVPVQGWAEHVSVATGRVFVTGGARVTALVPAPD